MVALTRVLSMMVVVGVLGGCAPTKQARSVEHYGFLGDLYPQMRKGEEGEALLVWRSPKIVKIPRGTYKKILLEPVTIWSSPSAPIDAARQKELQDVANLMYHLAYLSLAKDYGIVSEPGPNTLRFQAAITKAEASYVTLRVVSTIPAPMNALALASLMRDLGTGKPLFVGEASVEFKVSDSQTGDLFAAFADRRVGKRHLDSDSFDSWDDVHETLRYWAELARYRFCQQRGDHNCVAPKE